MQTDSRIDVSDVISKSRLGKFQAVIVVLCGLSLIMDGFDVQCMSYVAPALIRDWKIPEAALGSVFGAALLGLFVGSLFLSVLADRVGRRPVLLAATILFSVLTLITGWTRSIPELLLLRFLDGLCLGGIMPNAMALVGEFSPGATRVKLMMITSCGFTVGAIAGGFMGAWLIPAFGWRSVFWVGGAVPLAIALGMFFALPESAQFSVSKGRNLDQVRSLLKRIDPVLVLGRETQYIVQEKAARGLSFLHLFANGRAITTALLWAINFLNLLNLYFLASWIPTVARSAGYSIAYAVLIGTMLHVGGGVGTFALGWFIDRYGFIPVLTLCFTLACACIALIGQPAISFVPLVIVVFMAGWCIVGGQSGIDALAAVYYPTSLRATGIGWSLGVGRIGAIVGPVLAGRFIGFHWSNRELFLAAALPALVSALGVFCLRWAMRPSTTIAAENLTVSG